jgi:hypothetical protein
MATHRIKVIKTRLDSWPNQGRFGRLEASRSHGWLFGARPLVG